MEGSIPLNSNHDNKGKGGGPRRRGFFIGAILWALILVIFFNFLATQIANAGTREVPYSEFIDMVNQDKVATAELTLNKITFYLKEDLPAGMGGSTQEEGSQDLAKVLAQQMEQEYGHTVIPVSCLDLDRAAIGKILQSVLYEFEVKEIAFAMPKWITMLEPDHWLQQQVYAAAREYADSVAQMKDVACREDPVQCEALKTSRIRSLELATGRVVLELELRPEIFYQVLGETTGLEICDEASLMPCIISLARAKREYEKIRSALEQVEATGYGIVMPTISELRLEEPEIVHQGGRYGVRLRASAPSIHLLKATINTEISPIVGSEKQSEELVVSLLHDFEQDPLKIWQSNIFGKSLHELVNEGLQNKLLHMPQEARARLQETLERVINEGCTGLICIIL